MKVVPSLNDVSVPRNRGEHRSFVVAGTHFTKGRANAAQHKAAEDKAAKLLAAVGESLQQCAIDVREAWKLRASLRCSLLSSGDVSSHRASVIALGASLR